MCRVEYWDIEQHKVPYRGELQLTPTYHTPPTIPSFYCTNTPE
jgi:hypothetical protein